MNINSLEKCRYVLAGVLAVASLVAAQTVWAAHASETGYNCAEDAGGVGSCTANEVNIANVTDIVIAGSPSQCNEGDTITISSVKVEFGLNTGTRYDPLLWIGEQANDPRASGGTCWVGKIPSEYEDGLFSHQEGGSNDECLDVNNPGNVPAADRTISFHDIVIECRDADGDNMADMQAVVTWHQNTQFACGVGEPAAFAPGAPSKCDYSIIPLDINFVQQAGIHIEKTTSTPTVAPGETAYFTLTVTNDGDVDLDNVVITDEDCSSLSGPSGDTGSDGVLPQGGAETWVYTCSTPDVQASFTNVAQVTALTDPGDEPVQDSDSASVNIPTSAIPTLSRWMLAILAVGLAGLALVSFRRRLA